VIRYDNEIKDLYYFIMNTEQIILQIDAEIAKLQQARDFLLGATAPVRAGRGRPKKNALLVMPIANKKVRKPLSPEAKARIAAAQKQRWAKAKKS
jgi:hypothetical protein